MAVILTLGGIQFTDFEVPDAINFGGAQQLVVHKFVGGSRAIDAMGRDDDDIHWSGRFRGTFAESRARQLDYLRTQGQVVQLAWSTFKYNVIIHDFKAEFQQSYEIPYSISCVILSDNTPDMSTSIFGLDSAVMQDLNSVLAVADSVNIPAVSAAVLRIQATASTVTNLSSATASTLSSMSSDASTAQQAMTVAQLASNGVVAGQSSVAGMAGGGSPSVLASGLLAQVSAFSQLDQLSRGQAALGRMVSNLTGS